MQKTMLLSSQVSRLQKKNGLNSNGIKLSGAKLDTNAEAFELYSMAGLIFRISLMYRTNFFYSSEAYVDARIAMSRFKIRIRLKMTNTTR